MCETNLPAILTPFMSQKDRSSTIGLHDYSKHQILGASIRLVQKNIAAMSFHRLLQLLSTAAIRYQNLSRMRHLLLHTHTWTTLKPPLPWATLKPSSGHPCKEGSHL